MALSAGKRLLRPKLPKIESPSIAAAKKTRLAKTVEQPEIENSSDGTLTSSKKKPPAKVKSKQPVTKGKTKPAKAKDTNVETSSSKKAADKKSTSAKAKATKVESSSCVEVADNEPSTSTKEAKPKPPTAVAKKRAAAKTPKPETSSPIVPAKKPRVLNDSGVGSSVSSKKNSPASVKKGSKPKSSRAKRRLDDSTGPVDPAAMDIGQLLALGEGIPTALPPSEESTDSEDDDFEEVAEFDVLKEPVIPENGVTITLDAPLVNCRRKKQQIDVQDEIRKQLKRRQKEIQELQHKVHLLCWIAHIKFLNCVLNSEIVLAECHKVLSAKCYYPPKHADIAYMQRITVLFRKAISLNEDAKNEKSGEDLKSQLCHQFQQKTAFTKNTLVYMFVVLLRSVGLKARLLTSIVAVPLKPTTSNVLKAPKKILKALNIDAPGPSKESPSKSGLKKNLEKNLKASKSSTKKTVKKKTDDSDDEPLSKHFREKKKPVKKETSKTVKKEKEDNSDDDFSPTRPSKKLDRRVLSSDEESKIVSVKVLGQDRWVEVFLEAEEKWITVDVINQKVHCVEMLYKKATQPVVYVLACNNDSTLKDVTRRYVPHWHSITRKKRVSDEWWNKALWPYLPPSTPQDKEEDEDIDRQLQDKPLPTSISEYKGHPLYALKRHLLKFEAIYPVEAPTLGFVRGEPVYARECVVTLKSREIWFKEARVVRPNETPYKIVKTLKYERITNTFKKDIPLEIFGIWQTDDYIPPTAKDGIVPRNEYGNVDLFKPCMLPFGTVHLQNPALNRVARKLDIDCASAVVGFEYHSGGCHPVFDGVVVCEEFKDQLLQAWEKDVKESAKRAEEKRDKRIYGNWRRLIRGLIIRENLRMKYAFGENSDNEDAEPGPSQKKPEPVKRKKFSRK